MSGGWATGLDFGARIASHTPAWRDDFLRYWNSAIEIDGSEVRRIGSFAAAMKAHLVTGVIERDDGRVCCTALYFGPDGGLLGKHRKPIATASKRLVRGQGDGSTLPVSVTGVDHSGAASAAADAGRCR
jgi:nitrilase